ncbi:RND family efflux transporter MFP subunit [Caballeronia terrestris]|uniref:RND family efflux transporter MFP subunit n=1 Tax=Caballeronia terrestris TaxID=1226301 RepID=A0A158JC95_9BURK|nr:efflux RND transporter periplasmic adaptor subunit [Caballeronia terrestris]SAL66021.1 RND family efflux transporter MFP subunit [Caballeronia terrestris]
MNTPDAHPECERAVTGRALVPVVRARPQPARGQKSALRRRLPIALAGIAAALLIVGIVPRLRASAALTAQVAAQRAPVVDVISPGHAPASRELLLPGAVMPYAEASVYARTSGYIRRWSADIGTHVTAGQVLAIIETPELDAQLQQARADAATALANYNYATSTSQRWQQMLQTQSVAQQDADTKTADMQAKRAILASAQANVARLAEMVSYEKVTAPFDGVVTVRNVDVGALVTAGGTPGLATPANELFHIAQADVLRTVTDIPQDDASFITTGTSVYLTTQQYPGRRFPARVARSSDVIDPSSRTMRVEVDVDNRNGALRAGAYVQVHLALDTAHPALELPVSALLFRPKGVTVAVVGNDSKVALKSVTIGRDFGTYVEIATGLNASDRVIDNPGDAITAGTVVQAHNTGAR